MLQPQDRRWRLLRNVKRSPAFILFTFLLISIISWISLTERQPDFDDLFPSNEIDPPSWPIQLLENKDVLEQPSLYPPSMFNPAATSSYASVTAIISHVDKTGSDGLDTVIKHLLKYPYIKEILIYNQTRSTTMALKHYDINGTSTIHPIPVRVVNMSPSNETIGKYVACADATYDRCYFQDDLWLNTYIDTIYTHSHRYPDHLVVNSRITNYWDYLSWRFTNKDISLHTGYAEFRYGAIVSRQKALSFLQQLKTQGLDDNKLKFADVYFSIWMNQYPYIIANPLLISGRDRFKDRDTVNNRHSIRHFISDALSSLEDSLVKPYTSSERSQNADKIELMPYLNERDVRSSCVNDRCLFITNMDVMTYDYSLQYNQETFSNITQYEEAYRQDHLSLDGTSKYHKAVDQNSETCWDSVQHPKSGDYFGLYMLGDIIAKKVVLHLNQPLAIPLLHLFSVSIQHELYGEWTDCEMIPQHTYRQNTVEFNIKCTTDAALKSIRILFKQDYNKEFSLCGIGLNSFIV